MLSIFTTPVCDTSSEPGWPVVSRSLCRIDRVLSQSWRLYYTFLGTSCKIKWNSKPPFPQHPPKSRMKRREGQIKKTRHFPILDLGGEGWSRFSIYFVQNKMEQQSPIPPNQEWNRVKGKNSPFPHPGLGDGGSRFVQECRVLEPRKPGYLGTKRDGLLEELYSPLRSIHGCSLASLFTFENLKSLLLFAFWRSSPLR